MSPFEGEWIPLQVTKLCFFMEHKNTITKVVIIIDKTKYLKQKSYMLYSI